MAHAIFLRPKLSATIKALSGAVMGHPVWFSSAVLSLHVQM